MIMEDRIKINDVWYVREDTQKQRPYMLGDTWSVNFDYEGMLEWGLEINKGTPIDLLKDLLTSFEDVNYHREAKHLHLLIEAKQNEKDDHPIELLQKEWDEVIKHHIYNFKKECKETLYDLVNFRNKI